MNMMETILKLLSAVVSLFERVFPVAMAYLYGKKRIEKKLTKANYERLKKNADIASRSDSDHPVDLL